MLFYLAIVECIANWLIIVCYVSFLSHSCVCKEGEIGDGRSCYKDLLGEINQHNLKGRFIRKLNVAKKMFGKCFIILLGGWSKLGTG